MTTDLRDDLYLQVQSELLSGGRGCDLAALGMNSGLGKVRGAIAWHLLLLVWSVPYHWALRVHVAWYLGWGL